MNKFVFLIVFILIVIAGCSDNPTDPSSAGKGLLKIYLVDAPLSVDSVIIFVKQVEVHRAGSDSSDGWSVINDSLRSFDLLTLTNGASAVLGDTVLEAGKYTQIRLILNDENYLIDNGIKYNLDISSAVQSGIKLNHQFDIEPDKLYELLLDFNVDLSIHITGDKKYIMKPVIRVVPMVISGSISGQVIPDNVNATVFTTMGSDTISTYPDNEGRYKLMGLLEGSYTVGINSNNVSYKDTVINNIAVFPNQETNIGIIELQTN